MNKKKLTVIIPFRNEGSEVAATAASLRNQCGSGFDIVCVDDCSDDGFGYEESLASLGVNYCRTESQSGVAGARDFGAAAATTPYILLMDAHMRVFQDIITPLVSRLELSPDTLFCLQSVVLKVDDSGLWRNGGTPAAAGAVIDFRTDTPTALSARWDRLRSEDYTLAEIDIPCVMGAAYAIGREFYLRLHGLNGLALWGMDEAFLSTKVWRAGGRCRLLRTLEAGHIYRTVPPYANDGMCLLYNKIIYTYLLMPSLHDAFIARLAARLHPRQLAAVMQPIGMCAAELDRERDYLASLFTRSEEQILTINAPQYADRIYPQ